MLLWLLQPGQALIEKGLQGLDTQIGLRPPRAQAGSEPETDLDKVYQLLEPSAWPGKVVARNKQKEEIAEFLERAVEGKHFGNIRWLRTQLGEKSACLVALLQHCCTDMAAA